jgi:hypothetical protein
MRKIKLITLLLALGVSPLLPGSLFAAPPDTTMTWYNDWDGQIYTDYEEYLQASTIQTPCGEIQITKEKFVGMIGMLGVALSAIIVGSVLKSIL